MSKGNTAGLEKTVTVDAQAEITAFDGLPAELRKGLREAFFPYNCLDVAEALRAGASVGDVLKSLQRADQENSKL